MGNLTATRIKALTEPGQYVDGDGLMLVIWPSRSRSWVLRALMDGKRRDIGHGSLKVMTLAEAREKAHGLRRDITRVSTRSRRRKRLRIRFRPSATRHTAFTPNTRRNGKHQAQWISTLETYAFPLLRDRPVDQIEGPLIRDALAPIWLTKPETARRVRQRIGAVLDWSYVKG